MMDCVGSFVGSAAIGCGVVIPADADEYPEFVADPEIDWEIVFVLAESRETLPLFINNNETIVNPIIEYDNFGRKYQSCRLDFLNTYRSIPILTILLTYNRIAEIIP